MKKKYILPVFIGLLAVGGIIYGLRSYLWSLQHEETDNAQLEGNINPIIPKVSGYVTALMVEDAGKPVGIVHFHDLLRIGAA